VKKLFFTRYPGISLLLHGMREIPGFMPVRKDLHRYLTEWYAAVFNLMNKNTNIG